MEDAEATVSEMRTILFFLKDEMVNVRAYAAASLVELADEEERKRREGLGTLDGYRRRG